MVPIASGMVSVDGAVGGHVVGIAGVGARASGGPGGGASMGCIDESVVRANGDIDAVVGTHGGTWVSVQGGVPVDGVGGVAWCRIRDGLETAAILLRSGLGLPTLGCGMTGAGVAGAVVVGSQP